MEELFVGNSVILLFWVYISFIIDIDEYYKKIILMYLITYIAKIHHIFPKDYCEKQKYDKAKWNSVINKTPITYSTNREIGGVAPSVYLTKIENKGQVSSDILDTYLTTHWIDVVSCRNDNFQEHIIKRAKMLLNAIEKATGKSISGRDSEDVINAFGGKLS